MGKKRNAYVRVNCSNTGSASFEYKSVAQIYSQTYTHKYVRSPEIRATTTPNQLCLSLPK